MSYDLKPACTIDEQISKLINRDMTIEDKSEAARALQQMNYYRISGYAFQFLKGNDHYKKGTSLKAILRLMEFDTTLRQTLMSALEYIEIYARTQIAYWFSLNHNRDGGAHYHPEFFVSEEFHAEYIENLERQIERNHSQLFVAHHLQHFHGKMPLWCAVEILSFSTISKLYNNMKTEDKELIAANMDTDASHLSNWLHCFSILRNACAHYSRLYDVICSPKASLDGAFLRKYPEVSLDSLFAYIIAMLRIMPDEKRKTRLITSLDALFEEYNDTIQCSCLGFPKGWRAILSEKGNITLKPVSNEKKQIRVSEEKPLAGDETA